MQFLSFIYSAKRQYFSQDVSKAHMLCRSVSVHWNFYFLILIYYPWKWIYGFLLLACTQEFCTGFKNKVRMGKREKAIYHSLFCWIYLCSKNISLNFGELILVREKKINDVGKKKSSRHFVPSTKKRNKFSRILVKVEFQ